MAADLAVTTILGIILPMGAAFYLGCWYTQDKCDRRLRDFGRHIDRVLNQHRDDVTRIPR